jgi:hypothetical protein
VHQRSAVRGQRSEVRGQKSVRGVYERGGTYTIRVATDL